MAVVAAITATKDVKNERVKLSIIRKTVKQYLNVGKPEDDVMFKVYSGFTIGGLPAHLIPEKLIEIYSTEQTTRMQLLQAMRQSSLNVHIPSMQQQDDTIVVNSVSTPMTCKDEIIKLKAPKKEKVVTDKSKVQIKEKGIAQGRIKESERNRDHIK